MRSFLAILVAISVGIAVSLLLIRSARRRRADKLLQHPERLEQMLDPTDDA